MSPMNNRLLRPTSNYDADALRYMNAVQVADGQALEPEVRTAIDAFVRGCKADGIWTAIKASCIMAGARTISGALVPLVGTAPTPYNFASSDYSRTTGLEGDGSTTYLDSERASDADGQNDFHISVYETATHNDGTNFGASVSIADVPGSSISQVSYRASTGSLVMRAKDFNNDTKSRLTSVVGLTGVSRATSSAFAYRYGGSDGSITESSNPIATANYFVFAQNNIGAAAGSFSNARAAFYSIGSSLDLALLDARVTTLIAAIAAALS